ncbi:ankyrin repeat-containing domain protein [Peziza echinospora]|nr:ankyrin repeat-containing domain protein [Peziza echinospora]
MATGTTILSIGMVVCAYIVERSTSEVLLVPTKPATPTPNETADAAETRLSGRKHLRMMIRPIDEGIELEDVPIESNKQSVLLPSMQPPLQQTRGGNNDVKTSGVFLLWLQRSHTVSDQKFDSYVMFAKERAEKIITSRRSDNFLTIRTASEQVQPTSCHKAIRQRLHSFLHLLTSMENLTLVGTFCSLAGFVLQFQALRGLNWSASIAQLLGITIMTTCRAWMRRGITSTPVSRGLTSECELDWLALWLAGNAMRDPGGQPWPEDDAEFASRASNFDRYAYSYLKADNLGSKMHVPSSNGQTLEIPERSPERLIWTVALGLQHGAREGKFGIQAQFDGTPVLDKHAQRALKLRRRLGGLTDWTGQASKLSVTLASSIEAVMNTTHLTLPDALVAHTKGLVFTWRIDIELCGGVTETVDFECRLSSKSEKWKVDPTELEAALSLWLYHAKDSRRILEEKKNEPSLDDELAAEQPEISQGERLQKNFTSNQSFLRVLGAMETTPGPDRMRQDLGWWIGRELGTRQHTMNGISFITDARADDEIENEVFASVHGFRLPEKLNDNFNPETHTLVAVAQHMPIEQLFAQHLFTAFMWAIADSVTLDGNTTIDDKRFLSTDPDSILLLHFHNESLTAMCEAVQRTGLGSIEEILLSVVPPLSFARRLPIGEPLVRLVRGRLEANERLCNWSITIPMYLRVLLECGLRRQIYGDDIFKDDMKNDIDKSFIQAIAILLDMLLVIHDALMPFRRNTTQDLGDFQELLQSQAELKSFKEEIAYIINLEPYTDIANRILLLFRIQRRAIDSCDDDWWDRTGCWSGLKRQRYDYVIASNSFSTAYDKRFTRFPRPVLSMLGFPDCKQVHDLVAIKHFYIESEFDIAQILVTPHTQTATARDTFGWSLLHYAVVFREGDVELLTELLQRGAEPNATDLAGRTPLHYALRLTAADEDEMNSGRHRKHTHERLEATIRALIVGGADINLCSRDGMAPLHYAAQNAWTTRAAITILLEAGAERNVRDAMRRTPLHWCVYSGNHTAFKTLCVAGASLVAEDKWGMMPAHLAATLGDAAILALCGIGSTHLTLDGRYGRTPLHMAAMTGNLELLRYLNQCIIEQDDIEPPTLHDRGGNTALHLAAAAGHYDAASFLLEQGASPNARNHFGATPLCEAIRHRHARTVDILLAAKNIEVNPSSDSDIVQPAVSFSSDGPSNNSIATHNPLVVAAAYGDADLVQRLLDHGADVNSPGFPKSFTQFYVRGPKDLSVTFYPSALWAAAENNHNHITAMLLKANADIMATSCQCISFGGISVTGGATIRIWSKIVNISQKVSLDNSALKISSLPYHIFGNINPPHRIPDERDACRGDVSGFTVSTLDVNRCIFNLEHSIFITNLSAILAENAIFNLASNSCVKMLLNSELLLRREHETDEQKVSTRTRTSTRLTSEESRNSILALELCVR